MLSVFDQPEDSKQLYYKLRNSFQLADCLCGSTGSISGVYAIYKKGVCYYVGQSGNIASRLSTHLTGKYSECDEITVYSPSEFDFPAFYEWDKASQQETLINNEIVAINNLKPVENILVDREFTPHKSFLFKTEDDCDDSGGGFTTGHRPSFIVLKDYGGLTVFDSHNIFLCLDHRVEIFLTSYFDSLKKGAING